MTTRSQKIFDGGDRARIAGKYVPVMKKPRMDSLERLNAKWANARQARRDVAVGVEDSDVDRPNGHT